VYLGWHGEVSSTCCTSPMDRAEACLEADEHGLSWTTDREENMCCRILCPSLRIPLSLLTDNEQKYFLQVLYKTKCFSLSIDGIGRKG
jgi:hypothetical protein